MGALEELFENRDKLTNKQSVIADYIMSAPDEVAYMTLRELSQRVGASEVSILRMCHAVGLESFVELKKGLRQHNSQQLRRAAPPVFLSREADRNLNDREAMLSAVCQDELHNLQEMMNGLDHEKLFACARGLLEADEVAVFAHDASFLFAEYLAYRLNFLRIKSSSYKIGDSDSVQTALARLGKRDYVILLSFPPYHQPIVNLVNFCRYRGVRMMTITDSNESPAAVEDSSVFLCRTSARYYYNSQAATASFINILSSCIAHRLGARFDEILSQEREVSSFIFTDINDEKKGSV